MPASLGANTQKPGWMPGAIAYWVTGSGNSGEAPLSSTTSSRIWISSGSPSPSRSAPLTTASGVRPLAMSTSAGTLLVPRTKAATANGLSGSQACAGRTSTPAMRCALRQSAWVSGQ